MLESRQRDLIQGMWMSYILEFHYHRVVSRPEETYADVILSTCDGVRRVRFLGVEGFRLDGSFPDGFALFVFDIADRGYERLRLYVECGDGEGCRFLEFYAVDVIDSDKR